MVLFIFSKLWILEPNKSKSSSQQKEGPTICSSDNTNPIKLQIIDQLIE